MKNQKSGSSLAPECASAAIAVVLALVPAFAFAEVVSEPAKATVTCPEADCHVAPFFQGSGGFVGQLDSEVMVDGEPIVEVTLVVSCGNVTITHSVAPDADGKVAQLFTEDNGLACHDESGEIEIHGLMDGAWYWIHDERNSAVEHLLPKSVLGNMQTPPFDASGGVVEMTARDHATLVKDTASGRVGVLSHILPVPPPAPVAEISGCNDMANLRTNCRLTGDYQVTLTDENSMPVAGRTITRHATSDLDVSGVFGGTGHISAIRGALVTANWVVSGPGATTVPASYGEGTTMGESTIGLTVPKADAAALANPDDPCFTSNQQRDEPIAVVVTLSNSANTIPGFTDDGPSAMYYVACPAAASTSEGVEFVPDDPFPVVVE